MWLMSLTRVWTCYAINFSFQNHNLVEFAWQKLKSKIKISHNLGLKIRKSPSWNCTHRELSIQYQECAPISLIKLLILILSNCLWWNYSIYSITLHRMFRHYENHLVCIASYVESFEMVQRMWWGCHGLGDLNVTNKQPQHYDAISHHSRGPQRRKWQKKAKKKLGNSHLKK